MVALMLSTPLFSDVATYIVFDPGGSTFDVSFLGGIVVGLLQSFETRQAFVKAILTEFLSLTDTVAWSLIILHRWTLQLWNLAFPPDSIVLSLQLSKFSKGDSFGDSHLFNNIDHMTLINVSLAILTLCIPCEQTRKKPFRNILQFYQDFNVHWDSWFGSVHGLEASSVATTLFLHIMIDIYMYVKSSWLETRRSLLDDQVYLYLLATLEFPILQSGVLRCSGNVFDYWLGSDAINLIFEELTLTFEDNMVVLSMLVFADISFGFVYEVSCRGGFRRCVLPMISSVAMSVAMCAFGVMLLGGLYVVRSTFGVSTEIATCLWLLPSFFLINFLTKDGCKWKICFWMSNISVLILSVLLYIFAETFHWCCKKTNLDVTEEEFEKLMMAAHVIYVIAEVSKPSSHGFSIKYLCWLVILQTSTYGLAGMEQQLSAHAQVRAARWKQVMVWTNFRPNFSNLSLLLSSYSNLEDKVLIERGSIVMNKRWVPADYDATRDATEEMQHNFVWDTG